MTNEEHKKLVVGLIEHFKSKDLEIISADHEGYDKCETIGSHEPDVIAYETKNDLYYIGEAKTCDDLTTDHTREQLEDFANAVIPKPGHERKFLPFCIAIPKDCIDELEKCILEYGLSMNENIEKLEL